MSTANNDILGALGSALGSWMETMNDSQEAFDDSIRQQNEESSKALAALTSSLSKGRNKNTVEITEGQQRIVSACQQVPQLEPVLLAIVDKYMADITAAVESVHAKYTPAQPTPEEPSDGSTNQRVQPAS